MTRKDYLLQLLACFVMSLLLCPHVSLAADNDGQAYRLGEIVVSAPGSGADSVANVTRITAKQLKDMGARTLDDALRFVPGLDVRIGGAGTPRIDIHGFRTRHVLLLLDGVPIKDTYDDQFDPTTIPIDYIQEIKVSTGATSQLYGPGGNGGVINIITKKGAAGIHGSLTGEDGVGDAYMGRASLSYGTDKYNAFVSGSDIDRRALRLSDNFDKTSSQTSDFRNNSDLVRRNLFASFSYTPDAKTDIGMTFNFLNGSNGIPPLVNWAKNDPFSSNNEKFERTSHLKGYLTQLAFSRKISPVFGVRGWVYFNQLDTVSNGYDDGTFSTQDKNGAYHQDATTRVSGANLQMHYNVTEKQRATLGLILEHDGWDADGFQVKKKGQESIDTQKNLAIYSAVFEYDARLTNQLGMVFGYGHHFMDKDGGSNEDAGSYSAGLWYDVFDGTRLTASASRKVRFPSINQLYDTAKGGNPDLHKEISYQYQVGFDQALPKKTTFSVTAYHIDAKDFIEKSLDDTLYENFQKYRFKGVEVSVKNQMIENLMVRLAYSWLYSKDLSNSGRDELQYRPKDKLSFESTYRFGFGLTAYASVLYVAGQYFYSKDDQPLLKKKLNDYTVVDVNLRQHLVGGLSMYLGATNLFDENYEQSYGLPQPGRIIYGGLDYRF